MVDRKLRCPIGVGRSGGGLLGDWHRCGFAVSGRGRGEHQSRSSVLAHRLEQSQRRHHVAEPISLRLGHRFSDQRASRKVHHTIETLGQYRAGILDGALDEPAAGWYGIAVAGGQVIQDHDVVAGLDQPRGADTADIAGASGDQQPHPTRPDHRRRPMTACARAPPTSTMVPRPDSTTGWLGRA